MIPTRKTPKRRTPNQIRKERNEVLRDLKTFEKQRAALNTIIKARRDRLAIVNRMIENAELRIKKAKQAREEKSKQRKEQRNLRTLKTVLEANNDLF